jgi:selenide, water dikinase
VLKGLKVKPDPRLIVGFETSDDAGVYRLSDDIALIQTLDFFTPIVDTPYDFGAIAAANALSDVYAMGGDPITAMNIVCFPADDLPESVLKETLAGGLSKLNEADVVLAGGHSVDDIEFKYGLSVTGIAHPDRILTNKNSIQGDHLILTKPIGTGVLSTAIKGKIADETTIRQLIDIASKLNKYAADIMRKYSPTACTDVTGFGLAGHVFEMARASKKTFTLYADEIQFIEGVYDLARMGFLPGGAFKNKKFYENFVSINPALDPVKADLMFDPQTSGGLVFSLPESKTRDCLADLNDNGINARMIGEVSISDPCGRVVIQ